MIELNPTLVVLMAEALVAIILLIIVVSLLFRKKSKGQQLASRQVIDSLQEADNIKTKKLAGLISMYCDLQPNELNESLAEIKSNERQLYRQIIQMFLNRDVDVLLTIDQYVDNLSEPYCKLLAHAFGGAGDADRDNEDKQKMTKLMQQNKQLAKQLTVAMSTMDEISAEYTRVFTGTQTELELENSSKKMFEIFHQAEQQVKAINEKAGDQSL